MQNFIYFWGKSCLNFNQILKRCLWSLNIQDPEFLPCLIFGDSSSLSLSDSPFTACVTTADMWKHVEEECVLRMDPVRYCVCVVRSGDGKI